MDYKVSTACGCHVSVIVVLLETLGFETASPNYDTKVCDQKYMMMLILSLSWRDGISAI